MKHFKPHVLILALLIGYITVHGQDGKTATPQHSHPVYEKKLEEMQEAAKQAKHTYETAEETYRVTKEYDRTIVGRESNLLYLISFLFTIFGFIGIYNFFSSRSSKKELEEQARKEIKDAKDKILKNSREELEKFKKELHQNHFDEMQKFIKEHEETYSRMVISKETAYRIRNESKICVINQEGTKIPESFYKVLGLFKKFDKDRDKIEVSKLSDVLLTVNLEKLRSFDLVIIENLASPGIWEIMQSSIEGNIKEELAKPCETTVAADYNERNQAIIIKLANAICSNTSLIYYGKGIIMSNLIEEPNQPMFSFAQAPSTLFSNMMNLLKFKNVINRV